VSFSTNQEEIATLRAMYDERVSRHDALAPGYQAQWRELETFLLSFGGLAVVPPVQIEGIELFVVERGRGFEAGEFLEGEPNSCHTNSAELFLAGRVAGLASGFALSDDGLWRPHSWGVDDEGRAVETTATRERYVGVEFLGEAGLAFARYVLGE